mmetsp:Transcript_2542/g.5729  ORF Transcript_2542/g.5729 Transcript_2542/m.5729 type:complete len:230 (-) Transcript_2542:425-1114(-)
MMKPAAMIHPLMISSHPVANKPNPYSRSIVRTMRFVVLASPFLHHKIQQFDSSNGCLHGMFRDRTTRTRTILVHFPSAHELLFDGHEEQQNAQHLGEDIRERNKFLALAVLRLARGRRAESLREGRVQGRPQARPSTILETDLGVVHGTGVDLGHVRYVVVAGVVLVVQTAHDDLLAKECVDAGDGHASFHKPDHGSWEALSAAALAGGGTTGRRKGRGCRRLLRRATA